MKAVTKKTIDLKFEPLKDTGNFLPQEEIARHVFYKEKLDNYELQLSTYKQAQILRNGKNENMKPYGTIQIHLSASKYKRLHSSEHAYFVDKDSNFLNIPLDTGNADHEYRVEIRSLN